MITHVCLSDLHFGAETSLLTKMRRTDLQPNYQEPSETLLQLMECLRQLLSSQAQPQRPTLVLAGDALELALARTHQAAMAFETFLKEAFPGGDDDLFAREIIYVPGNHDHHAWELARENFYLEYIAGLPSSEPLGEEWHVTRLYRLNEKDYPEQRLLTGLMRRHAAREGVRVLTAYPNMGILSPDRQRSVIFTHGHYVEPLYSLMSDLRGLLFPEQVNAAPKLDITEIEGQNFAWIDFFWSTLGRSGAAGDDVQLIYELFGTAEGRADLSKRLAHGLVDRFLSKNLIPNAIEQSLFTGITQRLFERGFTRERAHSRDPLGAEARAGLIRYLAGPLLQQLEHECRDSPRPEDVTVVFGHTHKPFEERFEIPSYPGAGVDVFNTGGWVIDSVDREPLHGGAIVFVDDECNCASLRVYNERAQPRSSASAVEPVRVAALRASPLAAALEAHVTQNADCWVELTTALSAAVKLRARALQDRIAKREDT